MKPELCLEPVPAEKLLTANRGGRPEQPVCCKLAGHVENGDPDHYAGYGIAWKSGPGLVVDPEPYGRLAGPVYATPPASPMEAIRDALARNRAAS